MSPLNSAILLDQSCFDDSQLRRWLKICENPVLGKSIHLPICKGWLVIANWWWYTSGSWTCEPSTTHVNHLLQWGLCDVWRSLQENWHKMTFLVSTFMMNLWRNIAHVSIICQEQYPYIFETIINLRKKFLFICMTLCPVWQLCTCAKQGTLTGEQILAPSNLVSQAIGCSY